MSGVEMGLSKRLTQTNILSLSISPPSSLAPVSLNYAIFQQQIWSSACHSYTYTAPALCFIGNV